MIYFAHQTQSTLKYLSIKLHRKHVARKNYGEARWVEVTLTPCCTRATLATRLQQIKGEFNV